jgi:hypothetical protein
MMHGLSIDKKLDMHRQQRELYLWNKEEKHTGKKRRKETWKTEYKEN